jgi:hypothetical protein
MAKMLPVVVAEDTPSRAEIRFIRKNSMRLSEEWTALHSIGLATHDASRGQRSISSRGPQWRLLPRG